MRVFIANFGRQNYAWPECYTRSTVATMNELATQPLWEAGDREGYISYHLAHGKTALGVTPTRSVASRWFNLMTIIADTEDDIWVHREKERLWWTKSRAEPALFERGIDPTGANPHPVIICHKPCDPWSNQSRDGRRLEWNALHPKAREFLFTEGTLQMLAEDNATYALALLDGRDLSPWHRRPEWQVKVDKARKGPVTSFNARERAAWEMAHQAFATAAQANGQKVLRTIKDKQVFFDQEALRKYLLGLLELQEGRCALTDIPLQYGEEGDDPELKCSLDRIDSDGHYEEGNLQIVCRFANRWKNNRGDEEFRRLIAVVRSVSPVDAIAGDGSSAASASLVRATT